MSNYYVHRQSDDELEHSLGSWIKARARGAHKYIAKIPVGGKMRYFYTQAELAAYKAGKTVSKGATAVRNGVTSGVSKAGYAVRRAAGKAGTAVANATGYSAKQRADRLQAFANRQTVRAKNGKPGSMDRVNAYGLKYTAEGAARKARKAYEISPLGKLEKTVKGIPGKARDARLKVTDAAGKVRNVVGKAPGSIAKAARRGANAVADATGYSERQRMNRLDANYRRRKVTGSANGAALKAGKAADAARESYSKTALGRIEGAAKRAGSAVSGAAGKAKSAATSAAGTVRKTARKAGTAVANATGYSERQRAKRLSANAERRRHSATGGGASASWYNAYQASKKASQSYAKTPLGRIENAPRNAANAVSSAARKAGNVASSAAKKVGRAADRLDTAIYNARVDAQNKRAQATTKKSTKKRPHQRKTKKLNGTATVRKGDRVYY